MPISRAIAMELARLFDAVVVPIYVVDGERRIVFQNRACAAWTGLADQDFVGVLCEYHSSPDLAFAAAIGAALCPAPEAFAGQHCSGRVLLPTPTSETAPRQVDFIPLRADLDQPCAVLAIVSGTPELTQASQGSDDGAASLLHSRLQHYRRLQQSRFHLDHLLGESCAIRQVRAQVALASTSTASVLVVGPPGSGRQHVARAIHYGNTLASSSDGSLVPLACPLLGAELLQATIRALARQQLARRAGRPATLLLTDADQMPLEAQAELAGFLLAADLPMRLVSTSLETLSAAAAGGRFRQDLACLLGTTTIHMPRLTDRREDIPLLAQWFLELSNARSEKQLSGFTPEALEQLSAHPWPDQVDELARVIASAHAMAEGPLVSAKDLPVRVHQALAALAHARRTERTIQLDKYLGQIELELIQRALRRAKGNKTKAARLLGLNRPRLYRRMVQLGLEPRQEPPGD